MTAANAPAALALLFILVMVWFRTRLQYSRGYTGPLPLSCAGRAYFSALVALLAAGWFAAPLAVQYLGLAPVLSGTFARVAWFLALYLAFIPLHRSLALRGMAVFDKRTAAPRGAGS